MERRERNWQAAEREMERLLEEARRSQGAPAYGLFGPEHGPVHRLGRRLVEALLGPGRENLEVLDGREVPPAEVAARIASGGLLFGGERRVLWVQEAVFLQQGEVKALEPLLRALEKGLPPDMVLLLTVTGKVSPQHPLSRWLQRHGVLFEWPGLRYEREGEAWLMAQARKAGKQISPEAVAEMLLRCGLREEMLLQEWEKVLLYTEGRPRIEVEDVQAVVTASPEASTFDLVDALAEQRVEEALEVLRRLFEQRVPPLMILGMVLRQFRLLLQARTLIEGRAFPEPIWHDTARAFQEALQRKDASGRSLLEQCREQWGSLLPQGRSSLLSLHPFPFWKVMRQAERFSLPVLACAFQRLAQADLALKGNLFPPETALEMLVVDLCHRPEAGATLQWEELLQ